MTARKHVMVSLVLMLALVLAVVSVQADMQATALGPAFTYQGYLENGGSAVSSNCDFLFLLWDAASSGAQVGSTQTLYDVLVADGLFTVQLNGGGEFGASAFQGDERYLEVRVRCPAGGGTYTSLGTQALTAAPYAHYALGAPWSGLTDVPAGFADGTDNNTTYSAGVGLVLERGEFSLAPAFQLPQGCSNGGIAEYNSKTRVWVCGVDDSGAGGTYWSVGGNLDTDPATHYVGTSDAVTLTLRVDGTPALRLAPTAGTPNLIGGSEYNTVANGTQGANIGGGGSSSRPNTIAGDYATVSGGGNNTVSAPYGTIAGGGGDSPAYGNLVSDKSGTVGGGRGNQAGDADADPEDAPNATVAGGYGNTASGWISFVGGGYGNTASDAHTTVAGGQDNTASTGLATVGGGYDNTASGSASVVAGGSGNTAGGDYAAVGGGVGNITSDSKTTIGGGQGNQASDSFATIGGGWENLAGGYISVVAGGWSNEASGYVATVGGGKDNIASNNYATVAGGVENEADGPYGTIGGGWNNSVSADYGTVGGGGSDTYAYANHVVSDWGTVGGGQFNQAGNGLYDTHATVGGGYGNTSMDTYATTSGGYNNSAADDYAAIGGGGQNQAWAEFATIGGGGSSIYGDGNKVSDNWGTIGGGESNAAGNDDTDLANASHATVGGGDSNEATGERSTVAGGAFNTASSNGSAVGGGYDNEAEGFHATIGGGYDSTVTGWYSTIGGGRANSASAEGATIPGGYDNEANGDYSVAMGRNAHVLTGHRNSLVFGGSNAVVTESTGEGTVTMRAFGGYTFYTNSGATATGVVLPANSGSWSSLSDRNAKHSFENVDPEAILEAVSGVPIQEWSYTGSDVRHLGPMSQDFYAAFGLGDDDRHISTVDADGVALAAIQALYAQNQELAAENAAQQAQIDLLEQQNDGIAARLSALEAQQAAPARPAGAGFLPWAGGLLVAMAGLGVVARGRPWGGGR